MLGNVSYLQVLSFGSAKPHLLQMWLESAPLMSLACGTGLYWLSLRAETDHKLRFEGAFGARAELPVPALCVC